MKKSDAILIIGAGSIGERYVRNAWSLGYQNIVLLRQRKLPLRDIGNAKVTIVYSWEEADALKPKAAIICTPTSMHIENSIECVTRGIHVLIEKPLSHTCERVDTLMELAIQNNVFVQVGYMMRYYPWLIQVKELIQSKQFGEIIHMTSFWGEYLPDWHPWEDYRQSYAAKKELGGGAALTLSHDLDVCNWLLEQLPATSRSAFNYRAGLEVNVEAGADFLLTYRQGVTAHVHLNFFQKSKERWYKFIFEEAVIDIDFFKHTFSIRKGEEVEIKTLPEFDRNDLFIAELEDFFRNFDHPQKSIVNIQQAAKIIELCNEIQ
jgi:predicted dehydrogenase